MFVIAMCAGTACVERATRPPTPVASVFTALRDSLVQFSDATRIVAPWRHAGGQVSADALTELAAIVKRPIVVDHPTAPSCRWAPVNSVAVGMDLTVSEFAIVGDSSKISVTRFCQQRVRGEVRAFLSEVTWYLSRASGRWRVTHEMVSIT